MRVHVPRVEATQWSDLIVGDIEALAEVDRVGVHELVDDPAAADVVLFPQCHMVDWKLEAIRRHPVARRHWNKVMVYDERDRPWLSFPGVYVSFPRRRFDFGRQRAWAYLKPDLAPAEPSLPEPDLLFSFVGSPTAACRRQLFELRHPDAVVEEVRGFVFWDSSSENFDARRRRFRQVLERSRFVLCPRGHGTSSFRLYETIAAGRVPVIISDDWVAPPGPDWSRFSLRIAERDVSSVVRVLNERNPEWEELGAQASIAFREYFAADVAFHRTVELLADLRRTAAPMPGPRSLRIRAERSAAAESRPLRAARRISRLPPRL
jgi:hypothetical protein